MQTVGFEYPELGRMHLVDLGEPPQPGPGQILLETLYSGITNGTERHALLQQHGYGRFPGRHGYQHVARVAAVGDGVTAFTPDQVVFYGQYVGHRGWHLVHVAGVGEGHLCLPLDDGLDLADCAILGVAGVAMRGVRRCRVAAGERVWIAGQGLIGQFAAQFCRAMGALVTVSDVVPERLELARQLGAHRIADASDGRGMSVLGPGAPYQRIIDTCGVESLFDDIHTGRLLAHGGAILALAVRERATFPWSMLHGIEASIEVSCHFSLDDLRVVVHFLRLGSAQAGPLISHRVPYSDAPGIYQTLRDEPDQLLGVVFDWTV